MRSSAMTAPAADLRMRAKIVVNLASGREPAEMQAVLGCSLSQVYRVAARFVEEGEIGSADRREDNGDAVHRLASGYYRGKDFAEGHVLGPSPGQGDGVTRTRVPAAAGPPGPEQSRARPPARCWRE